LTKEEDSNWEVPLDSDDDIPIEEILKDFEVENSIATSNSSLRVEKSIDGRVIIYAVTPRNKKI
jgi:hypothetical protein